MGGAVSHMVTGVTGGEQKRRRQHGLTTDLGLGAGISGGSARARAVIEEERGSLPAGGEAARAMQTACG